MTARQKPRCRCVLSALRCSRSPRPSFSRRLRSSRVAPHRTVRRRNPRQTEHRPHSGRRHGMERRRVPRKRDQDAGDRPAREERRPARAVLHGSRSAVPTRACLMTGRHTMRYGFQSGVVLPWAEYGLPTSERTLAEALKTAGYYTAICGKWHLGHNGPEYLPTRRGFDHAYGFYNGAIDYFTHMRDEGLDWHRDDSPLEEDGLRDGAHRARGDPCHRGNTTRRNRSFSTWPSARRINRSRLPRSISSGTRTSRTARDDATPRW